MIKRGDLVEMIQHDVIFIDIIVRILRVKEGDPCIDMPYLVWNRDGDIVIGLSGVCCMKEHVVKLHTAMVQ
jgi:hypothetical protein